MVRRRRPTALFAVLVSVLLSAPALLSAQDADDNGSTGNAPRSDSEELVPVGVDFLPFVGTSSALPTARRSYSLNIVGGISGGVERLELSGVAGIAAGDVTGAQFAGTANIVHGNAQPLQAAGVLNAVTGSMEGQQLSGAANLALGDVRGAQIAPFNMSGGNVDGVQLGVFNVAADSTASIGLVSIVTQGFLDVEVFGTAEGYAMTGIRHGGDHVYNVYYIGTRMDGDGQRPLFGIGLGWRTVFDEQWEFSTDITTIDLDGFSGSNSALVRVRPTMSWRPNRFFALFGGPTLNTALPWGSSEVERPPRFIGGGDTGDFYVGFTLGLRIM